MSEYKERIVDWLSKAKEEKEPIEVVSFYNGLPIRVKLGVLDIVDGGKYVHWEFNPKLQLAVEETGKIFSPFYDKLYNTTRILESSVIYYSKNFLETTLPKPSEDGRFRRQSLRITVSEKMPIHVHVYKDDKPIKVLPVDISEGGIGIVVPLEFNPKLNQKVKLDITFPTGMSFNVEGEVVRLEEASKGKRLGLKFSNPKYRLIEEVNKYIMARQREIMNKIRMITDE